jgi:hypothetical protein
MFLDEFWQKKILNWQRVPLRKAVKKNIFI